MKKCLILFMFVLMCTPVFADTQSDEKISIDIDNVYIELIKNESGKYEFDDESDYKKGNFIMYNGSMYADADLMSAIGFYGIMEDERKGIYHIGHYSNATDAIEITAYAGGNKYDLEWSGFGGFQNEIAENSRFQIISLYIGKNKLNRNSVTTVEGNDPVIVLDGITYFPIRTLGELLGYEISYNYYKKDNEKNVRIYSDKIRVSDTDHWDNTLDYFYRVGEYKAKSSKNAHINIKIRFPFLKTSTKYISPMNGLLRIEAEKYAESIFEEYKDSETDIEINAQCNWVYGKADIISVEFGIKDKPETYWGKSIYAAGWGDLKYNITEIYDYIESNVVYYDDYSFSKKYYNEIETPIAPIEAINHIFLRESDDKYILELAKEKLKTKIGENAEKYYENALEIIDNSDFREQIYLKNDGVAIFCKPGEIADKSWGYIGAELTEDEIFTPEVSLNGVYYKCTDNAIWYRVFDDDGKSFKNLSTSGSNSPEWQYRIEGNTFYERPINFDGINKSDFSVTENELILHKGTKDESVYRKLSGVNSSEFRFLGEFSIFYFLLDKTDFIKDGSKGVVYNSIAVDGEHIIVEVTGENKLPIAKVKVNVITGDCINLDTNERINLLN